MRVDDELVSYVFKNHNNDKKSILRTNRLFDKFGNLFEEFTSEDYVEINNNRKRSLAYKYELKKVCNLFVQSQIVFFIFKGAILSVLLYGNAMSRVSNDIDIYVDNDNYDKALLLLKKNGFKLKSRAELKNEHHAVMIKNSSIVLELHHIDNYFYMGVVISDCSRIVKQRTREVILSEIGDEWYNPIYFAKIEI